MYIHSGKRATKRVVPVHGFVKLEVPEKAPVRTLYLLLAAQAKSSSESRRSFGLQRRKACLQSIFPPTLLGTM